jgi:hypothetical protein
MGVAVCAMDNLNNLPAFYRAVLNTPQIVQKTLSVDTIEVFTI